jgi:hypothetical protein
MKPDNSSQGGSGDRNQGEGDKVSARHYNRQAREFVADGKVDDAAREAKLYVERNPADAERAERQAKRGPKTRVSVDELIAKGRTVVDRVRPVITRAADKIRSRFGRK